MLLFYYVRLYFSNILCVFPLTYFRIQNFVSKWPWGGGGGGAGAGRAPPRPQRPPRLPQRRRRPPAGAVGHGQSGQLLRAGSAGRRSHRRGLSDQREFRELESGNQNRSRSPGPFGSSESGRHRCDRNRPCPPYPVRKKRSIHQSRQRWPYGPTLFDGNVGISRTRYDLYGKNSRRHVPCPRRIVPNRKPGIYPRRLSGRSLYFPESPLDGNKRKYSLSMWLVAPGKPNVHL